MCNIRTFKSLRVESLSLVCRDIFSVYRPGLYMKVTGSRSRSQWQQVRNSVFLQCKTLVNSNSGFVEYRAVKFVCSMGFLDMADEML